VSTQIERKTQTRAALLAAGLGRFAAVGFEHVTIDELASLAGVTRGAFYHHFESKDALFEEVFERLEEQIAQTVRAASEDVADASPLLAGCHAYIRMASKPATARIVLVDAPAVLGLTKYRGIDERHFLTMVTSAVAAFQPPNSQRSTLPLARALFAALCELALEAYLHPESINDITAAIETLTRNLTLPYTTA
jgi:AcrR family transcriptional regulator